mmetsp:Transcript_61312/g.150072  ORF Transcript_61312/g.150072 Transcript_61312/m.150072 type:complete len:108 (-) Transcript_61312:1496-1819(-)
MLIQRVTALESHVSLYKLHHVHVFVQKSPPPPTTTTTTEKTNQQQQPCSFEYYRFWCMRYLPCIIGKGLVFCPHLCVRYYSRSPVPTIGTTNSVGNSNSYFSKKYTY